MLQIVRCVEFGELLLDENRELLLLCIKCRQDFKDLKEFHNHLGNCVEQLFLENTKFIFDMCKGRIVRGKDEKKFHVYKIHQVRIGVQPLPKQKRNQATQVNTMDQDESFMDLINIEEELLNPRWYTDLASLEDNKTPKKNNAERVSNYKELVEEVTPYVQFKENVRNDEGSTVKRRLETTKETATGITVISKSRPITSKTPNLTIQPEGGEGGTMVTVGNKNWKSKGPTMCTDKLSDNSINGIKIIKKGPLLTEDSSPQPITKRRKTISITPVKSAQQPKDSCTTTTTVTAAILEQIPVLSQGDIVKNYQSANYAKVAPSLAMRVTQKQDVAAVSPLKNASGNFSIIQTAAAATTTSLKPHTSVVYSAIATPSQAQQQTALILNKLQTLGLQVKRTNPPSTTPLESNSRKSSEMDELLKKLQSKGMHIKVVSKKPEGSRGTNGTSNTSASCASVNSLNSTKLPTTKTNSLNKHIIIRRLN